MLLPFYSQIGKIQVMKTQFLPIGYRSLREPTKIWQQKLKNLIEAIHVALGKLAIKKHDLIVYTIQITLILFVK